MYKNKQIPKSMYSIPSVTVAGTIKVNFSCCGINYPLNKGKGNGDVLMVKYIWVTSGLLCMCVRVQAYMLNWEKGHWVKAEARAAAQRKLPWCPVPYHVFYCCSSAARGGRGADLRGDRENFPNQLASPTNLLQWLRRKNRRRESKCERAGSSSTRW